MQNLKSSVLDEVKPLSAIHEDATSVFSVGSKDILDWITDIIQYKDTKDLLADLIHARKLKLKAL